MKEQIFLCYSSADRQVAVAIKDFFSEQGFPMWRDDDAIKAGARFTLEIEQAIRRSQVVIALISQNAVQSSWVRNEILFAQEAKKTIIPVRLEAGLPSMLEIIDLEYIDASHEFPLALSSLLSRVQETLTTPSSHPPEALIEPPLTAPHPFPGRKNPFFYGSAVQPELFTGRSQTLNAIRERVGDFSGMQSISIVANRRMGKSSLLNYIYRRPEQVLGQDFSYLPIFIDAMDARSHSVAGFLRLVRRGIVRRAPRLTIWDEEDDCELTCFCEFMQDLAEDGVYRVVLLLDEWESIMAYPELDELLDSLRSSGSHSRIGMVTATSHELPILEAKGDFKSHFSNIFVSHFLGNFSLAECDDMVTRAFNRSGRPFDQNHLDLVFTLSGGHPYLAQLAGWIIWESAGHALDAGQVYRDFSFKARDIFSGLLQRFDPDQVNAVQLALGKHVDEPVPPAVTRELTSRGILTENGELFCLPFKDYVLQTMR